jgi:hypothetical protein
LIGCLFTVLRPPPEFFTYKYGEVTITGEGLQRRSGPLSRDGSISCHTCCDTGPRCFWSHSKDHPLTSRKGIRRISFYAGPHGSYVNRLSLHCIWMADHYAAASYRSYCSYNICM